MDILVYAILTHYDYYVLCYFMLCKGLIKDVKEAQGEDMESCTHIISTLTGQID